MEGRNTLFVSGRRAGRSLIAVDWVKAIPGRRLWVGSLTVLDGYIKSGLQPSQIVLTSELGNNSEKIGGFDETS